MSKLRLFHASEDPDIQLFEPRPAPSPDSGVQGNAVWAIDEIHLPNYLLPRDCPRVAFAAAEQTSPEDKLHFFQGTSASRVIAIEANWLDKVQACHLYLYEFPTDGFELVDESAGYYTSRASVTPESVLKIENLLVELKARNVDVMFLPNLWSIKEAVTSSSLEFSVIRFRNALPKPT